MSALRMQSLPFRIEEFVNYKILDIANQTILQAIKKEALLKNMPKRYIDNIQSEFDGTYLWIWVDFKGKNNEPLDVFFEEGTRDHYIKPKNKKALAFTGKGTHASAIYYTGSKKSTGKKFSKGHYVSGIDARYVFADGLEKSYQDFKNKLKQEIEDYLKETSLFG